MGIVFETKSGAGYKKTLPWMKFTSQRIPRRPLTQQNAQFLKTLGLKLRGKSTK